MSNDIAIEVTDLVRDYEVRSGPFLNKKKITRAVDSLSFFVNKGEVFGLLGPNGAGKTTTIKILTTLLAPTSGSVKILGFNPIGEEKHIRPRINFIYGGDRNLYWRISARANLDYFSDLYKLDKETKKRRIEYLLNLVQLTDRADERVENYSKGMKQRLQIARGLINDPDILFLDEPTIGLDPVGAKELREIINNLSALGKTIILTTHYMHEADEVCDRIAIVNKGKLIKLDTPENLKKDISKVPIIEVTVKEVTEDKLKHIENLEYISDVINKVKGNVSIIEIHSKYPYKDLSKILEILGEGEIVNIQTRVPTLEDVYLEYIR